MARAGRPYAVGKEQLRHALLLRAIGERAAHSVVDALDAPELLSARYSQLRKLIKMGGYARGWQGRRRRVSGRALALRARLALAWSRPFCPDGRRDFVYSCLVDSARGRDLRVVDSAELVVTMRESP